MTFTGGASKSFDMLTQLEYREELTNCSNEIMSNSSKLLILRKKNVKFPEDLKLKNVIGEITTRLKRNILDFGLINM